MVCHALSTVYSMLYIVRCIHTVLCALYTVHCTLYTAHCTLYTAYCILHTAYCILYPVSCILYPVCCAPLEERHSRHVSAASGTRSRRRSGRPSHPSPQHRRRSSAWKRAPLLFVSLCCNIQGGTPRTGILVVFCCILCVYIYIYIHRYIYIYT